MTTYLNASLGPLSSTANYQALMGAIDAHIQSFGWVLTSDTGQTDPSGAALPSSSASSGYRVYRTNDGLTPIYMRIDYYCGTTTSVRLDIQLGWGTDGAGTLTGNTCTQISLRQSAFGSAEQLAMAGGAGWLTITYGIEANDPTYNFNFTIERECDSSGADVATGFNVIASWQTNWRQQYVPSSGTVPNQQTSGICAAFPYQLTLGALVSGGNKQLFAAIPPKDSGGGNPMRNWFGYNTGAGFANNTTTTVTCYGTTHTYIVTRVESWNTQGSVWRSIFRYE